MTDKFNKQHYAECAESPNKKEVSTNERAMKETEKGRTGGGGGSGEGKVP